MTRITSMKPVGERAIRIGFEERISEETNRYIAALCKAIEEQVHPAVTEWVPAYASLTVYYKPETSGFDEMKSFLESCVKDVHDLEGEGGRVIGIPVLYGGEGGPDLSELASHHGMDEEEVIRLHSEGDYLVYMLGFNPGFPYLGGLSDKLHTPRRDNPRQNVPAGSVGIAGEQTGIYPLASPGGWQLIGRTPARLFDPEQPDAFLLRAGDRLRFRPVDEKEYDDLCSRVENGEQIVEVEEGEHAH
ncbi:5-oxoprolinase subunit PxpB [Alteribacter natronophilus]|uniref:5-oxoprolinase subunit PxpB n=1 Tax=Alteribacter natronophilus TaxID=2583810 RepID=UPI00110D590B|nr:5-oxoprolinase subunit PxpB [Alteribacter natronophilus]TMW72078.1 5-oxoprolinase subunit PxpB [Alteribacter natronophilus]